MAKMNFICLANSRKNGGRCIAGKLVNNSGRAEKWIRPVSKRTTEELNFKEIQYSDNTTPKLLDLIEVDVEEAKPNLHQQENWILNDKVKMIKKGEIPRKAMRNLVDDVTELWANGSSSNLGKNDRVPPGLLKNYRNSLALIEVSNLTITKNYYYEKVDLRGQFQFKKVDYKFKITDPEFEYTLRVMDFGKYHLDSAFLTISLAETEYKGFYYKLIAGIITTSEVTVAND